MITTARLALRRFTLDDVDLLVDLDNDPEVMAYIDRGPGPTATHVREVQLPKIISEYATWPHHGMWATHRRDTGEFVGWLALRPHGDRPPDEPDMGWRLRRAAWGHGFATEVARALLDHAFTTAGASRVTAETMAVNARSRAVMERLGLRHVDTYRAEFDDPIPGTELGEVVYAITRAEWEYGPGMGDVMSRCPVCGHRVYVGAGEPTPPHDADGTTEPCKGAGQPSK